MVGSVPASRSRSAPERGQESGQLPPVGFVPDVGGQAGETTEDRCLPRHQPGGADAEAT